MPSRCRPQWRGPACYSEKKQSLVGGALLLCSALNLSLFHLQVMRVSLCWSRDASPLQTTPSSHERAFASEIGRSTERLLAVDIVAQVPRKRRVPTCIDNAARSSHTSLSPAEVTMSSGSAVHPIEGSIKEVSSERLLEVSDGARPIASCTLFSAIALMCSLESCRAFLTCPHSLFYRQVWTRL